MLIDLGCEVRKRQPVSEAGRVPPRGSRVVRHRHKRAGHALGADTHIVKALRIYDKRRAHSRARPENNGTHD
jgi:hypothetical protein